MSDLERLLASCLFEITNCDSIKKAEEIKTAIFGKNGKITERMKQLRELDDDEKRRQGAEINSIKQSILDEYQNKINELETIELNKKLESEFIDISMPSRFFEQGKIHPLTKVNEEISRILSAYGFMFATGPEIESEFFNFTAMNMEEHHPARNMHDTFYVNYPSDDKGQKLLRTHTSPVQIHAMLNNKAPFKFFSIGRVFRSDYDATHTPMFTQIEGIVVDENIGFSHLKWLLTDFLKKFFNINKLEIRFRPSFFPFTEPSAEVDLNYEIVNGKMIFGQGNNWLEIGGCGVIHPTVLNFGNVDTKKFQGIAFGLGLERLTSLKYGIPDLRSYFESNERWRNTFSFKHNAK